MKVKCQLGKARSIAKPTEPLPKPPSRVARQLALAHQIDRMIEAGELRDYADAARRLKVSRARVTQIMNLVALPIAMQERILLGEAEVSERGLR